MIIDIGGGREGGRVEGTERERRRGGGRVEGRETESGGEGAGGTRT
jgi:hypothetical protein